MLNQYRALQNSVLRGLLTFLRSYKVTRDMTMGLTSVAIWTIEPSTILEKGLARAIFLYKFIQNPRRAARFSIMIYLLAAGD